MAQDEQLQSAGVRVAAEAAFRRGLSQAKSGRLQDARAPLTRASELGHPTAAFNLGLLLELQGDILNARQLMNVAISLAALKQQSTRSSLSPGRGFAGRKVGLSAC